MFFSGGTEKIKDLLFAMRNNEELLHFFMSHSNQQDLLADEFEMSFFDNPSDENMCLMKRIKYLIEKDLEEKKTSVG